MPASPDTITYPSSLSTLNSTLSSPKSEMEDFDYRKSGTPDSTFDASSKNAAQPFLQLASKQRAIPRCIASNKKQVPSPASSARDETTHGWYICMQRGWQFFPCEMLHKTTLET